MANDKIRHPELAARIVQASEGNPHVPDKHRGRLPWFQEQLEKRHGLTVTRETVRKWLVGESWPRPEAMTALADILGVELAFLSAGKSEAVIARDKKLRGAEVNAISSILAGFIRLHGSVSAFPRDDDELAKLNKIDLTATIRGAHYSFHVALAHDGVFTVPIEAQNTIVIGAVQTGPFSCEFYELDWEGIKEHAKREGTIFRAAVDGPWKKIETFAERL